MSDSASLSIPKLRDDGSNWLDYEPRIKKAMGAKGFWMHVEGRATAPTPYRLVNNVPTLSDGKTPAMEEQVEAREMRIMDYEKREYYPTRSDDQKPTVTPKTLSILTPNVV